MRTRTTNRTRGENYLVAMTSSGLTGQSNWRWCNKCQALSFAGSASLGACSGGGQHDHAGSGNYVLAQTSGGTIRDDNQTKWKWCKKCQVLAYAGKTSKACGAGGVHDYSASGNYIVGYVVGADTVLREAYMKALKPKPSINVILAGQVVTT